MGRNSYPQGQIDDMEPSTVQELVTSLKQLHDRGKPETEIGRASCRERV